MTYRPRRNCRRCGTDRDKAGGVSRSGLCRKCGPEVMAEAITQIRHRYGQHYSRYAMGLALYVESLQGGGHPPAKVVDLDAARRRKESTEWLAG